jgi:hypothetical protein
MRARRSPSSRRSQSFAGQLAGNATDVKGQHAVAAAPGAQGVVKVVTSMSAVSCEEWDGLGPENSFYISHDWLAWVARDRGAEVQYLLFRDGGRLLGALPLYDVERETNDMYLPGALHDGRWPGRYLVAGTRRAYINGLLTRRDYRWVGRSKGDRPTE